MKRSAHAVSTSSGDWQAVALGALAMVTVAAWAVMLERHGLHGFSSLVAERLGLAMDDARQVLADVTY